MEIKKYKYLNNSRYELLLEDKKVILYEDIIIKHEIILKKELTLEELNNLLKENEFYELYYKALDYIKRKIRSKKEIDKYLLKTSVDKKLINKVVDKLKLDGYLDDRLYAKSYIHDEMSFKLDGPLKIKKYLIDLGLDEDIVLEELKIYLKEDQILKIKNYVKKQVNLNRNKSTSHLKEKILHYLINQGFYKEDILNELEKIEVDDEDLYKKEYDKQYKKLSTKYSGKELEYKLKQKMYSKGFHNN